MKKLLLITPRFFTYHTIIKEAFEKSGYSVTWFDDRPSTSTISKCLIRLNKNLLKRKTKKYFKTILNSCEKNNYDEVLIILGQSFYREMIDEMREVLPKAKYIFYMWDAIANFPDRLDFSKKFDFSYTFDSDDSKNYPNDFSFLPLFTYDYRESVSNEIKYDFSFIGTIKKGKYSYLKLLFEQIESQKQYTVFKHFYLQSKLIYHYYKITDKDFKKAKKKDFVYFKIPFEENAIISKSTKYIIDCPMKNQNGLSMRTFEALGWQKKLITSNKNVINYDFYNPNNIYVYDGVKIDFSNPFFKAEYEELDPSLLEKYSIEEWIKQITKGDDKK